MQRYYPHYNHLYSVAALTGDKLPNGNVPVVERYSYDAYGKQTITSATGSVRAKSAFGWDRGFTGYIADGETGLMYARARMYSTPLGCFVSRDPWMANPLSIQAIQRNAFTQIPMNDRGGKGMEWLRSLLDLFDGMYSGPTARDGYHDGLSLYSAYFVPNKIYSDGMTAGFPMNRVSSSVGYVCTVVAGTCLGTCTCSVASGGGGSISNAVRLVALQTALNVSVPGCCMTSCLAVCVDWIPANQPVRMTSCVERVLLVMFGPSASCSCW